jgi:hypothetical protein
MLTQQKATRGRNSIQELFFLNMIITTNFTQQLLAPCVLSVAVATESTALVSATAQSEIYGLIFKG